MLVFKAIGFHEDEEAWWEEGVLMRSARNRSSGGESQGGSRKKKDSRQLQTLTPLDSLGEACFPAYF